MDVVRVVTPASVCRYAQISKYRSTRARGSPLGGSMLLPGAHAIGHTVVEVGRAHDGLYAPEPQALPDVVAHTREGEGDALALQLLDEVQQCVAGAYVDEVHGLCVHKHALRRRAARGQRSLQPVAQVTDAGKPQVAAGAPDQKPGKGERFGVPFDVAIGLRARHLTEHGAVRVAGSVDQKQQ